MKKYELTDEAKTLADGTVLHRIRAVRYFTLADGTDVRAGDLGGWVEREDNFSHDGSAWVCGEARVYGEARVCGEAEVYGEARVFGNAEVCGEARVFGGAVVCGGAEVCGNAEVFGNAEVCGEAVVCGNAEIYGEARVCGNAEVYGEARVFGNAEVCGEARVFGEARVCGGARVCGEAEVKDSHDYAVFKNTWSSGRWFTYTRSDKMWAVGCFRGTGDELIAKAYMDGEVSGQCYEAIVRAQEAIEKAGGAE